MFYPSIAWIVSGTGEASGTEFESSGSELVMIFTSDSSGRGRGFSLQMLEIGGGPGKATAF